MDWAAVLGRWSAAAAKTAPDATSALRSLCEGVLALACGALFGLASVRLLAPLPVAPAEPSELRTPKRVLAAAETNPFFSQVAPALAAAAIAEADDTALDLTLHGTWIAEDQASAVIRTPDGAQKTFRIGDEICCGARLVEALADRAIIERDGVREALRLPRKEGALAPTSSSGVPVVAAQPAPAPVKSSALRPWTEIVRVEARPAAGGLVFHLQPAGDGSAFRALGLEAGDALIEIDGAPAPASLDAAEATFSRLAGASRATLTVERGGVRRRIEIAFGSRS